MDAEIIKYITIIIAVIGAVLGVLNTWQNYRKEQIKLIVNPSNINVHYMNSNEMVDELKIGIEVVNISSFPVTLVQLGFAKFYRFTNKLKGSKSIPLHFKNFENKKLPHRLDSLDSVTFYLDKEYLVRKDLFENDKYAFAQIASGKFFKGTSKSFKLFLRNYYINKYA